ncbi:hypothetical protein Sru01_33740 [Sphaerisporangium rufum]|uniref:Uncharacterized protein n=1 Tax=Sphaerisporangium rufum TaxID=1381558 RepID=A0A919R2D2_9ACTN|nr:hypothetical protein Sru01_33740 [Sphaerisporangium rufum]
MHTMKTRPGRAAWCRVPGSGPGDGRIIPSARAATTAVRDDDPALPARVVAWEGDGAVPEVSRSAAGGPPRPEPPAERRAARPGHRTCLVTVGGLLGRWAVAAGCAGPPFRRRCGWYR